MSIEYKELNINNLDKVVDIYIKAFNCEPWNDKWTKETTMKRLSQMMNCEGSYGIMALEDEKVLGMVLGNHEYYYNSIHFHIKEICVDSEIKGRGIGKTLLDEFSLRLKEKSIDKIILLTCKSPQTIGFYKKMGFEIEEDIILMEKNV